MIHKIRIVDDSEITTAKLLHAKTIRDGFRDKGFRAEIVTGPEGHLSVITSEAFGIGEKT